MGAYRSRAAYRRIGSFCIVAAAGLALSAAAAGAGEDADETTSAIPRDPVADMPAPAERRLTASDLPPPSVFSPRVRVRSASLMPQAPGSQIVRPYRASSRYSEIIAREAAAFAVPPELVEAVMATESGYNPAAVGADGEIGLMQILPSTARMLGFTGTTSDLAAPEINIHYGARYLAGAWHLARQDICTAAMKYRAGHGETRFSFRSVDYCVKVRAGLAARGFPVTGIVPQPTFGEPAATVRGRAIGRRAVGGVDLAGLNARLRELTSRMAVRSLR